MTRSRYSDFGLYRRLVRQALSSWPHLSALFLVGLLASPLALLTPLPLKIAVDSVLGSRPLPGFLDVVVPTAVTRSPTLLLVFVTALAVLIALLSQLQALASKYLTAVAGERLVLDFRARIFRHLQRISLSYHDSTSAADSQYRIQTDAAAVRYLVVDGFIPSVSAAVTLAGMIYVMIRMDWQLTLVALAVSPPLLLVTRAYRPHLRSQSREVKKMESAAMAVVHEVLGALRVVKAFGQEEREGERFVRRSDEGVRRRIQLALAEGHFNVIVGLTTAAGTAAVLFVGIGHVRSGLLSLGDLLLMMGYVGKLYEPIKTISRKVATVQGYLAGVERALAVLDEPSDVEERPDARPLARARGDIALRGVSFSYGKDRPVLHDVSFDIEAGTRLGIVGASGAGKSTLINLLARFYDPTDGQILLDGADVRDYRLEDLRRQFAFVLQDTVLFSTSVAENIAYANPGADRDAIMTAAQAANAHEFIARLPQGYDSQVGERGVQLSGGQRQRIAIARAFLQDSPVLILDEPTSAVDAEAESAILGAIRRLMRGRTVILITHRSNMLEGCAAVLALENGRVAAADTTRALVAARATAAPSAVSKPRSNVMNHPAARAWRQLHPHIELLRITPIKVHKRKNMVYRIDVADRAPCAVIAKRCGKGAAQVERAVYEEILPRVAVQSLGYHGFFEEPDGEYCWIFVEEATGIHYSNLLAEHRAQAARWLGLLHTSAVDAAPNGRLPGGGPDRYLCLLRAARDSMQQHVDNPVLTPDDVIFIERVLARLHDLAAHWDRVEAACDGVPQTLVHGDFNGQNLRVRCANGSSTVVVFDWEDAGWGVPAVDLAQLAVPSGKLSANPDITTYWSTVRERWPDASAETLRRLAACGTVFRALAALNWDATSLPYDWAHSCVGGMHVYAAELEDALERLGWDQS
jgi:ATP-binding cassette subfamily B protein